VNRVLRLIQAGAVTLERFDHVPGVAHRDPERERAAGHRVNFVEAGAFRVRTIGAWRQISGDRLFVTRPGLEFSCAHDEDHPSDCCLSVAYSAEAMESARSSVTFSDAPVRALTNRHAFLRQALRTCRPGDEARTEAIAGALLWSLAVGHSRQPLFRPERLAWYAARVERVKAMIEDRYHEPLSLSAMARDSGMSVFHFARIFGELEGRAPHRFLTDVRLAHARARLRDGASVTETCFAVGFGSLSHFITVFRRRYGVTPSRVAGEVHPADVEILRAERGDRIDA
jgi:AraC-like DNA-binding protein